MKALAAPSFAQGYGPSPPERQGRPSQEVQVCDRSCANTSHVRVSRWRPFSRSTSRWRSFFAPARAASYCPPGYNALDVIGALADRAMGWNCGRGLRGFLLRLRVRSHRRRRRVARPMGFPTQVAWATLKSAEKTRAGPPRAHERGVSTRSDARSPFERPGESALIVEAYAVCDRCTRMAEREQFPRSPDAYGDLIRVRRHADLPPKLSQEVEFADSGLLSELFEPDVLRVTILDEGPGPAHQRRREGATVGPAPANEDRGRSLRKTGVGIIPGECRLSAPLDRVGLRERREERWILVNERCEGDRTGGKLRGRIVDDFGGEENYVDDGLGRMPAHERHHAERWNDLSLPRRPRNGAPLDLGVHAPALQQTEDI